MPSADDIAGRVEPDFEAGLLHQSRDVLAAFEIGSAECDAADATFRIRTELRQCLNPLFHAPRVSVDIYQFGAVSCRGGKQQRADRDKAKPTDKTRGHSIQCEHLVVE